MKKQILLPLLVVFFVLVGQVQAASNTDVCFATHDNGETVQSSADSQAIRDAVALAPDGGTVKVAGVCTGSEAVSIGNQTTDQTIYISKSLTLQGGYAPPKWNATPRLSFATILDADGGDHVAAVDNRTSGQLTVNLDHLIFRNAVTTSTVLSGNAYGGGIFIDANVAATITNVEVYNNRAEGGAGLYSEGSTTIANSFFYDNSAERSGGAIFTKGALTVSDTAFYDNDSDQNGGAIYATLNHASSIRTSTFYNNVVHAGRGGAIHSTQEMVIENSTFSSNSATYAGAIYNNQGDMTLTHSTIVFNTGDFGSGVSSYTSGGTVTKLRASIVAMNNGSPDLGLWLNSDQNTYVSQNFNLIGSLGADVVMNGANDVLNTMDNPVFGLGDNGGETLTHALRMPSTARDVVTDGNCLESDQRGVARDALCDIGAYEDDGTIPTAVALVAADAGASGVFFAVGLFLSVILVNVIVFGRNRTAHRDRNSARIER